METTAANWEATVTGALHRLKAAGAVLRFKDGWGLADHYPDSLLLFVGAAGLEAVESRYGGDDL